MPARFHIAKCTDVLIDHIQYIVDLIFVAICLLALQFICVEDKYIKRIFRIEIIKIILHGKIRRGAGR